MSRASKKRSSDERKAAKSRKKAAKRALYASYAINGANSKSKRFTNKKKRANEREPGHPHAMSNCGNNGCNNCFPRKEKK